MCRFRIVIKANYIAKYIKMKKRLLLTLLGLIAFAWVHAQVHGTVIDATDKLPVPFASVSYKDLRVSVVCDVDGHFRIAFHPGHKLSVSSIGYSTRTIQIRSDKDSLIIALRPESGSVTEVTVKARRKRYRRKDNPAVELMRKVIARKKETQLDRHDYYSYEKYQKITLSENNIDTIRHQRQRWYLQQVEKSPIDTALILPISVDETLSRMLYRKDPHKERTIIEGKRSTGVNKLLQTGDIINSLLKEVFQDVNINDDHVRLLQYPFPSPIGKTAISFYHFYIEDTLQYKNDSCYHVLFYPANQQDFGFKGELYITKDSALQVKHCVLDIPKKSDINFVDKMRITQDFAKLPNGDWVLSDDKMYAVLRLTSFMPKVLVVRNTTLGNYDFSAIDPHLLKGNSPVKQEPSANIRSDHFWDERRTMPLTAGEKNMDYFVYRITKSRNFGIVQLGVKMLIENFVETSKPGHRSRFDFGPINTLVSHNFVDGYRFRLSGRTMAALNPHLFWNGFVAYGNQSHKWYYNSEVTYSFNTKENSPFEYPVRSLTFETSYDLMSPADKYLTNNKDNVFESFRTQNVKQMYFYNRQRLTFTYETDWGMSFGAAIKTESNKPAGDLHFIPVDGRDELSGIRTTELSGTLRFWPNQSFINTKQRRWPINLDSPDFQLTHTVGLKHLLGGQYSSNMTELKMYKRLWFGSFGALNLRVIGRAQWNKVPFPLLCMPPVSLTYFTDFADETFSLMRNMEFLNDRYVMWSALWEPNGKLLNRIPLIKKLKWREVFAVKGMWGHLTSKNDPSQHPGDNMLFKMPDGVQRMTDKPYWEVMVGINNIFKVFGINYVRRLTYLDNPNIDKWGIRFTFMMQF